MQHKTLVFFAMPWNYTENTTGAMESKIINVRNGAQQVTMTPASLGSPASLLVAKGESNGYFHCDRKNHPGSNFDCDTREIIIV